MGFWVSLEVSIQEFMEAFMEVFIDPVFMEESIGLATMEASIDPAIMEVFMEVSIDPAIMEDPLVTNLQLMNTINFSRENRK